MTQENMSTVNTGVIAMPIGAERRRRREAPVCRSSDPRRRPPGRAWINGREVAPYPRHAHRSESYD